MLHISSSIRALRLLLMAVVTAATALAGFGASAQGFSVIRDAETENTIRDFATPLFQAAGIDPKSVRFVIVNDESLNAFVGPGNRMFIHTGLILQSKNSNALMGVLAHETGHLAGGHLVRLPDAIERATTQSVVALLLGGLAGLATGRGDVGAAIAGAGANIAQQQFFGYTRGNEESADQAAMEYLDRTGISARGLLTVLDTLSGQELLVSERQDVYMRTHPLSRDRMSFVRQHVQDSPYSDEPPDPERERQLARVQAKLRAFTLPKGRLPRLFDESDDSVPSRYGRAIVAHRNAELEKAIGLMDSLLAEAPQDPYFHELRGQILFESQRGRDALDDYRRAVEIAPDEPQIRIGLAQVEIELNEPELLRDAVVHLNRVLHEETRNTFAWRQLAIAYGRLGEEGLSALCLAEEAAIQGRGEEALRLAKRAAGNLEDGSPAQLRARDLQATVERARKQ